MPTDLIGIPISENVTIESYCNGEDEKFQYKEETHIQLEEMHKNNEKFLFSVIKIMQKRRTEGYTHEELKKIIHKNQTPLTAEILNEYGFERINQDNIFGYPTWCKNDNEYLFEADEKFYHCFITSDNNEVKTLERLKLIYLALNNEELTKIK
jgi:hypothetical protein